MISILFRTRADLLQSVPGNRQSNQKSVSESGSRSIFLSLSWVRVDRVKFLRPARDIPWPALLSRESRSDLVGLVP